MLKKTFFMLNPSEPEIFPAYLYVGILTLMCRKNSVLRLFEVEKKAKLFDIFILTSI